MFFEVVREMCLKFIFFLVCILSYFVFFLYELYVMGGYVCMYTTKCSDAFIYLSSFVVVVSFGLQMQLHIRRYLCLDLPTKIYYTICTHRKQKVLFLSSEKLRVLHHPFSDRGLE